MTDAQENEARKLIKQMTCINPQDGISAAEALQVLQILAESEVS